MTALKKITIAVGVVLISQTHIVGQTIKNFCISPVPKYKTTDLTKINYNSQKLASATQATINVVFHVVWKTPEENISDSIIHEQMKVLNNDFNKLNADTGNLKPIFKPIAGNTNIHFNLHQVIRKQTTKNFYLETIFKDNPLSIETKILSEAHYDSTGGSNAIDPSKYLNI